MIEITHMHCIAVYITACNQGTTCKIEIVNTIYTLYRRKFHFLNIMEIFML